MLAGQFVKRNLQACATTSGGHFEQRVRSDNLTVAILFGVARYISGGSSSVRYVRSPTIGATRPSPERADGPSYFRRHDTRKCYAKLLAEGAADKFPGSAVRWGQAEAAKKRKVAPLGNAVCGSRSKSAILAGHLTNPKLEAGCPGDTGPKPGSLPRSVSSHTPDRRCSNGGKTIYLRWQVPLVDWSRDGQQSHMRPIVASTVACMRR